MMNVKNKFKNETFFILPNDIYVNEDYTNEEILIFCLLQKFYIPSKNNGISSVNVIKQLMYVKNRNKNTIDLIRNGILRLIEKQIIYNIGDINENKINFNEIKNDTLFTYSIDLPTEQYFKVYENFTNKIFKYLSKSGTNINKFAMFRYFTSISRVLSNQSNFGYLAQSKVKFCGESRAITRYNKTLQDELNIFQYNNDYCTENRRFNTTFYGWYGDNCNFNNLLQSAKEERKLI